MNSLGTSFNKRKIVYPTEIEGNRSTGVLKRWTQSWSPSRTTDGSFCNIPTTFIDTNQYLLSQREVRNKVYDRNKKGDFTYVGDLELFLKDVRAKVSTLDFVIFHSSSNPTRPPLDWNTRTRSLEKWSIRGIVHNKNPLKTNVQDLSGRR